MKLDNTEYQKSFCGLRFPQFISKIGIISVCILCGSSCSSSDLSDGTVKIIDGSAIKYILTPSMVSALSQRIGPLGPNFDVTSDGNIIIRSGQVLLEVETSDDGVTTDKVSPALAPDDFVLDRGSTLLTISGRFFGQLEDDGYTKAITLPDNGMSLASSSNEGAVYLFGGLNDSLHRVYRLSADGQLRVIASLPSKIMSIADSQKAIYVATEREVYRVSRKRISLVIRLSDDTDSIVSIAASPDDKAIFFASDKNVYLLHGLVAIAVIKDTGGQLRLRNENMYLWDQRRRLLVRFDPEVIINKLRTGA